MKTTIIQAEDISMQQERSGFVPVCQYGRGMGGIITGEIGSICRFTKVQPQLENGLFIAEVVRLERIIVKRKV